MKIEILKPFGPSIAKVKIPSETIFSMNEFVEEIIKDKKRSEDLDYGSNLAGNVQQEFKLDLEFMKKNSWAEFLGKACQEWLKQGHNISVKKFEIISSWIVRQFKNEYNPIHYHGGHISGVGYLKVPVDMGQTIQKNKNVQQNGKLVLIDGSKKLLCNPTYVITPELGDFYLFPSYMMHTVYPFSNTLEERRSVSFNAKIDDESATLR
jgi:hypothetical protein|tara:strand:+ start:1879 stop:2502 length:624 start_codon:yes stop_codon:yes gene_type:complete